MGEKGARLTSEATDRASAIVDDLAELGDVASKKMFGGYGVFESGVMFVLIDSAGTAHLRSDETTAARFTEAGSTKHGRMPYWAIPEAVLEDREKLVDWARDALDVARAARKR